MSYNAHSPQGDIPGQPYAAHIHGVRTLANQYACAAGQYATYDKNILQSLAEAVACFHDLGKLNSANQKVLAVETKK